MTKTSGGPKPRDRSGSIAAVPKQRDRSGSIAAVPKARDRSGSIAGPSKMSKEVVNTFKKNQPETMNTEKTNGKRKKAKHLASTKNEAFSEEDLTESGWQKAKQLANGQNRRHGIITVASDAMNNLLPPIKKETKNAEVIRKIEEESKRVALSPIYTPDKASPRESPVQVPVFRDLSYLMKDEEDIIDEDKPTPMFSPIHGIKGSETSLIHPNVGGLIERLQKVQLERLENDIKAELQEIRKRVSGALRNVDFLFEGVEEEDQSRLPFGAISLERERELERQEEVREMIKGLIEGYDISFGLLDDVERWFDECKSLGLHENPDRELNNFVASSDKIKTSIMKSLAEFQNANQKMVELGSKVIKEAGDIIKDNEAASKKMKSLVKEKITIYDEHELMVDSLKWEKAVKTVSNTFENAVQWTKNSAFKSSYSKGQKQFKNLTSAMAKKITDLNGKQREVDDIKKKMLESKAVVEKKQQDLEETKKSIRKISREVEEKTKLLEMQEKRNQGLNQKLMGHEQKIKAMEKDQLAMEVAVKEELSKKEKEIATLRQAANAAPPPPKIQKAIIKVQDPELVQKLKDTEEELERLKVQMADMSEKITELERQIRRDKERIRHLKEDLDKAEKAAAEAAMTVNIPTEPVKENQETTEAVDKDSAYYKKLLKGMKKDFAQELEKLKTHLEKERARGTAASKRAENIHKDQLTNIQKDVVRVLRAIMHFREHMCTVMEKDNLKDLVYNLQQLGTLIPDKLAPDPKDTLNHLVSSVVEFMHKMEVIIANAFLAMRMMIKGSIQNPNTVHQRDRRMTEARVKVHDVEGRVRGLDAAKHETQHIAGRLRQAKERLVRLEMATEQEVKDKKYFGLLDRYHRVWKMYSRLHKDMITLQSDFQTSIDQRISDGEIGLVVTNIKQRQRRHQELKLSIQQQKENLQILEEAYKSNKISKDLYMMATAMLRISLSVPGKRLQYLMEQYINYRRVQDAKERIDCMLADPQIADEHREDLEQYLEVMEAKIQDNIVTWQEKMQNLQRETKQLNENIWRTFNEVLAETGVMLVHPMFDKNTDRGQLYSSMAQHLKKETLKKLLKKRNHVSLDLKLPPMVLGNTCNLISNQQNQSTWSRAGQGDAPKAMMTTPHSLNYEVNKPRIDAARVVKFHDQSRNPYPLKKMDNYLIKKVK